MGFVDDGQATNRNNRRLQKSLRKNFLNRKYAPSKKTGIKKELSKKKYAVLEDEKRKDIKKRLSGKNRFRVLPILLSGLVLIFVGILVYQVPNLINKTNSAHELNVEEEMRQKMHEDKSIAYKINIDEGYRYLDEGLLDKAQNAFTRAVLLFEDGKEANRGLTKCLIVRCLKNEAACDDAVKYLDALKESDKFSKSEIDELEALFNN